MKELRITPREKQIIKLLAAGFDNREIAAQLGTSYQTVKRQRFDLSNKDGFVKSLSEMVTYAVREGWISLMDCHDLNCNKKVIVDTESFTREEIERKSKTFLCASCRGVVTDFKINELEKLGLR